MYEYSMAEGAIDLLHICVSRHQQNISLGKGHLG